MSLLDEVLREVKDSTGVDLCGYRRPMLERRLAARVAKLRLNGPEEYLDLLDRNPGEGGHFIDAVGINVSSFFRDPIVFEILAQTVLPEIIARKSEGGFREIRAWCCGCARGEEAYSLAILLHLAFQKQKTTWPLHLFGTDIDRDALECARRGIYPRQSLQSTRLGIVDDFFILREEGYEVQPFIRKMVEFAHYDVTSPSTVAPPQSVFGTFDLVLCRNVIIYFSPPLQDRAFDKLHKSLVTGGFLVLGTSEQISPGIQRPFTAVDSVNRIYRKSA